MAWEGDNSEPGIVGGINKYYKKSGSGRGNLRAWVRILAVGPGTFPYLSTMPQFPLITAGKRISLCRAHQSAVRMQGDDVYKVIQEHEAVSILLSLQ